MFGYQENMKALAISQSTESKILKKSLGDPPMMRRSATRDRLQRINKLFI